MEAVRSYVRNAISYGLSARFGEAGTENSFNGSSMSAVLCEDHQYSQMSWRVIFTGTVCLLLAVGVGIAGIALSREIPWLSAVTGVVDLGIIVGGLKTVLDTTKTANELRKMGLEIEKLRLEIEEKKKAAEKEKALVVVATLEEIQQLQSKHLPLSGQPPREFERPRIGLFATGAAGILVAIVFFAYFGNPRVTDPRQAWPRPITLQCSADRGAGEEVGQLLIDRDTIFFHAEKSGFEREVWVTIYFSGGMVLETELYGFPDANERPGRYYMRSPTFSYQYAPEIWNRDFSNVVRAEINGPHSRSLAECVPLPLNLDEHQRR